MDAIVEWNDANIETLKTLWARGLSASQIMGQIPGASRSGILGKISRLKLPPRDRGHGSQPKRQFAAKQPRAEQPAKPFLAPPPAPRLRNGHDPSERRNPSHNIEASIASAETAPGLSPILRGEAPDGTGIKFIDLMPGQCKWPKGDPLDADFEFCGCKALSDLPYCAPHTRRAIQPTQGRNRADRALSAI